jgi:hypothetical protein
MKLYTEHLTLEDLRQIGAPMGIRLENATEGMLRRQRGKFAGKYEHSFVLRPDGSQASEYYRLVRDNPYSPSGKRRVHAISWQGHWDFMVQLFNKDPDAVLVSAIGRYEGREGFYRDAPATGDRNIGSVVHPQSYRNAIA